MEEHLKTHRSGFVVFLMYVLPMIVLGTVLSGKWYVTLIAVVIAAALWLFPFRGINLLSRWVTVVLGVLFFALGVFAGVILPYVAKTNIENVPGPIVIAWFMPMGVLIMVDIIYGEIESNRTSKNRS